MHSDRTTNLQPAHKSPINIMQSGPSHDQHRANSTPYVPDEDGGVDARTGLRQVVEVARDRRQGLAVRAGSGGSRGGDGGCNLICVRGY